MDSLDRKLTRVTRCTHVEACDIRVPALLITFKYELLDSLRRPIFKYKLKDANPFF